MYFSAKWAFHWYNVSDIGLLRSIGLIPPYQLAKGIFYFGLKSSSTSILCIWIRKKRISVITWRVWRIFVYRKPLNGYFGKQWSLRRNAARWGISSGYALFAKTKSIFRERYFGGNYKLWPLDKYNGPSQVHCINPEGRFHMLKSN